MKSLFDRHGRQHSQTIIIARKILVYLLAVALIIAADPRIYPFVAGCILITAGLALRFWTFGHLAKNRELTTSGPYAHTRNPGYLGSALAGVGLFLAGGNAHSFVGIAVWFAGASGLGWFVLFYLPRKYRVEYSRLETEFGQPARDYAANVPDFWPRLQPWVDRSQAPFSLRQVSANHEWAWTPLCALALALMWLG